MQMHEIASPNTVYAIIIKFLGAFHGRFDKTTQISGGKTNESNAPSKAQQTAMAGLMLGNAIAIPRAIMFVIIMIMILFPFGRSV